jgi:hypothetical protein
MSRLNELRGELFATDIPLHCSADPNNLIEGLSAGDK